MNHSVGATRYFQKAFLSGLICFLLLHAWDPSPVHSQWQIETVVSEDWVGEYCSLALDESGNPYIAYFNAFTGYLYLTHRTASGWITEQVTQSVGTGHYASLAFDGDGHPGISYQDIVTKTLKYARYDGSSWSNETVDDSANVGQYSALAFDSADRPHIAYGNKDQNQFKYTYYYAGIWNIFDLGYPGYCTDLVLSQHGSFPHACAMWPMSSSTSKLYYFTNQGTGWTREELPSEGRPGSGARIALVGSGIPTIAHYDSITGMLYVHSINTQNEWEWEIVDSGPYIGETLDLSVDSGGRPHISYHDAGLGHLKHAYRSGSAWQTQTVDTDGTVGSFSSVAIDATSKVHIAYYDSGRKDLRYAVWQAPPAGPWLDLSMSDLDLRPGDSFNLICRGANPATTVLYLDEYILLDVYGHYWFYPSWSRDPDSRPRSLIPGDEFEITVLEFTWPPGTGTAAGLYFHGAWLNHGTTTLLAYDHVGWGYSEVE